MGKRVPYPKLRAYVKRGKKGQVWTSWAYDMRGTGMPDIPLGKDYAEALKRWAEIHHNGPRVRGTIEEAFQQWEQRGTTHRADGRARSAETIRGYLKCLKEIRPAFGGARWDEISLPVLRRYVEKRTAKGRARQEMQLLSVIWKWALLEGLTALPWPAEGAQRTGWKGSPGVRNVEVSDAQFDAIYKHADPVLRDFLDIATATGLRGQDVCALTLGNVRDGKLTREAAKTGKRAEFDLSASPVLRRIIKARKAITADHLMLLSAKGRPVSYRSIVERFHAAREAAAKEVPSCAGVWLRDFRKRAAQLAPTLREASTLLQHSSTTVTQRHYRRGDKIKPVR